MRTSRPSTKSPAASGGSPGRFAAALFALMCIFLLVASGGCEVIVGSDPKGFPCAGGIDAGGCPVGEYCFNATCVRCEKTDVCDGRDNDCDGIVDNNNTDKDKDGFTACGRLNPDGTQVIDVDCDDSDPDVRPGGTERCNGKDDDCNGQIDDGTCPVGEACAPKLERCVAGGCTPQSCTPPEVCDVGTRQCGVKGATKIGDGCFGDSECETGAFCGYSTHLADIRLRPNFNGICTKPCCTSIDCPANFVCFGAGTGGNYCVNKGDVGRPTLGSLLGGEACDADAQCRSGICDANSKKCQETCCKNSDCPGQGAKCRTMDLVGRDATTKRVLGCSTAPREPNPAPTGELCEAPGCALLCPAYYPQCAEGVCDSNGTRCRVPCCGTGSCSTKCDNTKPYNQGTVVTACSSDTNLKPGPNPLGAACEKDSDCEGNHCFEDASHIKYCSDACCTDADCEGAGLVCRPHNFGSGHNYLRCERPVTPTTTGKPVRDQ